MKRVVKVKFIYSEKATNFYEISTADLSHVVTVKSPVEISQNFVAFSEYMNFTMVKFCITLLFEKLALQNAKISLIWLLTALSS